MVFAVHCFGESKLPFKHIDLSSEFIQVLEIEEKSGKNKAANALREKVIIPNNDLYEQLTGGLDQKQLIEYLEKQAPSLARTREVSHNANQKQMLDDWNEFIIRFPDMQGSSLMIYSLPSFGRFEAQARPFDDKYYLFLGIDEIAKRKRAEINSAMVHHELFHLYHYQMNSYVKNVAQSFFEKGEFPQVYMLLWVEGLATHASRLLNAQSSNKDIFFSDTLYNETKPLLPNLIAKLSEILTSNSFNDIAGFFYFPTTDQQIPKDCGYVIGELIIIDAMKRHNLKNLVEMKGEDILKEVRVAIKNLMLAEISASNQSVDTN